MNGEMIVIQPQEGMPIMAVESAMERYRMMNQFVSNVLREDTDYGKVPGTDKNTLLKPGAEKLALFFGLRPTFQDVTTVEDWSGEEHGGEPFFYYRQKCRLLRGGEVMAEGEGSCNSHESKYRYRMAERVCPNCGKAGIKRSKDSPKNEPNAAPGWYCWAKIGGCGAQFTANDKRITEQAIGRIANPDIADQANTFLKMAQKRALVAAVLIGANASDYFTQDVEDLPGYGDVVEASYTVRNEPPKVVIEQPKPDNGWDDLQGGGPQPKPKPAPHDDAVKPAKIRTAKFNPAFMALLAKLDGADVPHTYRKADGGVDWYHVTGSVAKCGFDEITEENLSEVIAALENRIMEKATADMHGQTEKG